MLYSPIFPAQGVLSRELWFNLLPVWYETQHWACSPNSSLHDMKRRGYWRRETSDAACQSKGSQCQWIQPTKKLELPLRSFNIHLQKSSHLLRKSAKKELSLYIVICKVAFSCPFGLGRAGTEGGEVLLWVTCYPLTRFPVCCRASWQLAAPKHPNL